MATTPTKPDIAVTAPFTNASVPAWPRGQSADSSVATDLPGRDSSAEAHREEDIFAQKPSQRDALQALLAFSALHEQVRRRKAIAARHAGIDAGAPIAEFDHHEQFVLDEVLQLVAERAVAITGADGLAIALAENNEIVLRASAGTVRPDVGARIDRDSAFSGACFRQAEIVTCDDTETDPRVNLQACRRLGARSMVAVPLCGRRRVIGLLEAFSEWPFAFNESDVRNLSLLAELVLGALKPEDEDRFAQSAQVAAVKLEPSTQTPLAVAAQPALPAPVVATPTVAPPAVSAVAAPPVVAPPVIAAPLVAPPVVTSPVVPKPPVPPQVAPPQVQPQTIQAQQTSRSEVVRMELAVPGTPVVDTKPLKAEVASAPATAILEPPALEKAPELEAPATAETAVEPTIAAEETESPARRLRMPLLLVGILVVVAVAAVGLWKMKTAQLGSLMVRTERIAPKPANTNPSQAPAASPATDASVSPTTTVSDAIPDSNEQTSSPATQQELAKFPKVTGIRHWSSADSSTVVLDLEDQVQYEAHRLAGPDRIYFDLHDTQLAPELSGKSIDVGDTLINRIRVAQPIAGMTRIVLETKPNTNFSVSLESNPYRLLVEVRKIGANAKTMVNLFPNAEAEKSKLAIVIPPPTKEDLSLRARVPKMRIVVDAGHGGWDLGTVGRRGLLEKDLVLEIAQRLGKLLENRLGMEVIYTRQDDNYIPLDERAGIANQAQADLFVSVHANYSDLPSARGVETYYTNFFSAPGSKEAGSKDFDTRSSPNAVKAAATPTLSPAGLHDRIEHSRHLAASVQRALYGTLSVQNPGLRDRGIKEAGFVVLTESAMPGILAEVSFVSSPTDEQKLRSDGYREQIAEALYKGIARYAAASRGVKVATAGK
ncbi:MAG TPA: N-acetylmuramoyl-L-alanine amidase [Candidatus Sulfotelmatobacter sp.]|nr:N-acetylmuramoyl-L-alanine amidase [Candidatus Sulfotelmatobacter sp.]